jgi:hypothetical protein
MSNETAVVVARGGRPRKHNRLKVTKAVCARVARGERIKGACAAEGVDPSTVREWAATDDRIAALYARAREWCADAWFEEAIAIAHGEDGFGDLVRRTLEAHIEASQLTEPERRQLINAVTANVVTRDRLRVDTLKWAAAKLAPKKYGKPSEETAGKPDANAVDEYLKRRHEQRRLNELAVEEERERNSNRIIRVVEEIPSGRLTPQERRMYLARELAGLARDAGKLELAKQLDELEKFAEEHPIDGPPSFTFNIDKAGGDEPDTDPLGSPRTTIVLKREPRTLDGNPGLGPIGHKNDATSEPNDEPVNSAFIPPPAPAPPSRAAGNNGNSRFTVDPNGNVRFRCKRGF